MRMSAEAMRRLALPSARSRSTTYLVTPAARISTAAPLTASRRFRRRLRPRSQRISARVSEAVGRSVATDREQAIDQSLEAPVPAADADDRAAAARA